MGFTADAEQRSQGYNASCHGDEFTRENGDDFNREAALIDWRMFAPWKQKKSKEARNLESASERLMRAVEGMSEVLRETKEPPAND